MLLWGCLTFLGLDQSEGSGKAGHGAILVGLMSSLGLTSDS